jgi:hypothetical protein
MELILDMEPGEEDGTKVCDHDKPVHGIDSKCKQALITQYIFALNLILHRRPLVYLEVPTQVCTPFSL